MKKRYLTKEVLEEKLRECEEGREKAAKEGNSNYSDYYGIQAFVYIDLLGNYELPKKEKEETEKRGRGNMKESIKKEMETKIQDKVFEDIEKINKELNKEFNEDNIKRIEELADNIKHNIELLCLVKGKEGATK